MDVENRIKDIQNYGYTSLEGFVKGAALDALVSSVNPHLSKAEAQYGTAKNKAITLAMFRTFAARGVMRDIIFGDDLEKILSGLMVKPFVEHTKILVKAPKGLDTPWHQDAAFWEEFDPQKSMLSLWIALEPVTLKNGCLEIIKTKTPVKHILPHEAVRNGKELEISDRYIQEALENGENVSIEMKAGDALIFDSTTIHRALSNQTDGARIGLKIVFQDQEKRQVDVPKHMSSMEMIGFKGIINKTLRCAVTARRA